MPDVKGTVVNAYATAAERTPRLDRSRYRELDE